MAKPIGLTSIRHQSNIWTSDGYLIDVNTMVFAIWGGIGAFRQQLTTRTNVDKDPVTNELQHMIRASLYVIDLLFTYVNIFLVVIVFVQAELK